MCTFLLQVITAWKDQVPMFTQSYYMKKKSNLTPFIAHEIKKMKEKGITNVLTKRHVMPEPNCKPPNTKGTSLGMEKFASLFVFYINCCIVSLIILVMENVFKPSKVNFCSESILFKKYSDKTELKLKFEALEKEIKELGANKAMILLNDVKLLMK